MLRGPYGVLSTHLDDAALSCSWFLQSHPGSTVCTILAGTPKDGTLRTTWDCECGFYSAAAAMTSRRGEDAKALELLSATPMWSDGLDGQYLPGRSDPSAPYHLRKAVARLSGLPIAVPLGLHHPDHVAVSDAAITVLQDSRRGEAFWVYEDVPYRQLPNERDDRLAALQGRGLQLDLESEWTGEVAFKREVLARYRSQWQRLLVDTRLEVSDAFQPERFWRARPT